MGTWRTTWLSGLCSVLVGVLVVPAALPVHDGGGSRPQLYLDTAQGIAAIDAENGAPSFTAHDARPAGDWSRLVSAAPDGTTTRVSVIDAIDGTTQGAFSVDGRNDVRVVSYRGDLVALSPHEAGRDGHQPGRERTTLVVAATDGSGTRTYDLPGNVEPEAFSTDGRAAFVIDYLPPMQPDRYQVRRLDLATGQLGDVPSPDGANQGQMPGVARTQVMAPDGSRLYTLYTSADEHGDAYSFVHVLDLDGQWAHCVDLPRPFGQAPEAMSLAITPNGSAVYVADVASGRLAEVSTNRLTVARTARTPVRGFGQQPHLAASSSLLYVAVDRTLIAMRTPSLVVRYHEALPSAARGLAVPSTAPLLYVAHRHAIDGRDPTTGSLSTTVRVDTPHLVGLGYGATPPSGDTIKCAC